MKKLKKVLLSIIILFALIGIGIFTYLHYKMPTNEGELQISGISKETTVYFDKYGVPHIYATSEHDAMVVLGYVHAQDRLWQMELIRRIAPGRLSELFGTKALKSDKMFAGIGINETSEKIVAAMDKNSDVYKNATAYLDGLNQFLENGTTPLEFQLVGVKKQKFTLIDVCNIYGYMAFSFAVGQKTDPVLTDIRDKWGSEYLKDLGIDGAFNTTQIKNFEGKSKEFNEISKSITSIFDNSPVPAFIGSNSWVIGGGKTKSGKVIFANDPHIAFSQPCTWYEAHINSPNHEMYGYYVAGTPFPLLGHNHKYAYGLTMFTNDDVDLFQETENPTNTNQYKTIDGYKNYTILKKTIKVKDSDDVVLNIKQTIHGPIMNDMLGFKNKKPISMWWIYTQQESDILKTVSSLSHSKNVDDFYNGTKDLVAPGLNIMYGDAKGNIAWRASGKLYKQDATVNPNFILNGANGIDDKREYLDASKNPMSLNPPSNYVYSANNQSQTTEGFLYPGYYAPNDRAQRIVELIEPKNNWTKDDVAQMILDDKSIGELQTAKNFLAAINTNSLSENEKMGIEILKSWNGNNGLNDVAPTIYNKFIYRFMKNTFEDELGNELFELFINTQTIKHSIEPISANDASVWWNNVTTQNIKETRKEVISQSYKESIAALEKQLGTDMKTWVWSRVHTLEHQHPLGKVAALRGYFNVGPNVVPGSHEVINNLKFQYNDNGQYNVFAGPSTRRIIDFSDVESSISILPTGQSGVQTSPHYSDQAEMYNTGKFRKMMLNKKEIIATSSKLIFKPKK